MLQLVEQTPNCPTCGQFPRKVKCYFAANNTLLSGLQLYNVVSAFDISYPSLKTKTSEDKNISDAELVVDLDTFVNDYGLRRKGDSKQSLRTPWPEFYPPLQKDLKLKIMDLMRQSLYGTQDNMRALDPILEKYNNDPALRMAFIFDRLHQIIIDIRRVYTLALKWRARKRVLEQILWYSHCLRKFIDVLYIVELLIDKHMEYLNNELEFFT